MLIAASLIWGAAMSAYASDANGYFEKKLPEQVTDRFSQAFDNLQAKWLPGFIDSLMTEGSKNGMPEYTCMANILNAYKAYVANDSVKFFEYSELALQQTKALNSSKLYYNLLANQVGFYINRANPFKAQQLAETVVRETTKSGDEYGMMNGYLCLAMMASDRSDYQQGIDKYEKALVCMERIGSDDVSRAQMLYCIGHNYLKMSFYKKALNYFDQALKLAPEMYDPLLEKAMCYFKMNEYDQFKEQFRLVKAKDVEIIENLDFYNHLDAINASLDGNKNKALAICDSITDLRTKYLAKADVYSLMNDWKSAYESFNFAHETADSVRQASYTELLLSADSEMAAMYKLHEKEAEIRQNRIVVMIVSFVLLLIAIISASAVFYYRQRVKWQKNRVQIIKRYNAQLEVAKEKAEQADRMKTMFLQNISHDLRTPLNAIIGFSQLLGLPDGFNSEDEKQQYNSYISNNSEMLMMLFEDILNMNEIEKGNFKVEISDTECNTLCRKILKCVEYRVQNGVSLNFTSNVDDNFIIKTDGRRVQQVVINFLTNACKHTTQGEIRLDCNVDEVKKTITFSVIDTGEGVPEDIRDTLFERFVKRGTKDSHGIGLSICSTIAEKMNGTVSLDKSYTSGAKFDFTLNLL